MAVGTCWKREGTDAYFYSKKGAWKYPLEIRGIDPMEVVPGYKYEIANDFKSIIKRMDLNSYYQQDVRKHGLDMMAGEGLSRLALAAPAAQASPTPQIPLNGLMASATGVVKSCIEKGMTPEDSARAGLAWARLWSDLPPRAERMLVPERPPATAPPPEPTAEGFDDDIPF